MQINRLFEIVYSLLNKKTLTAKELSERLEVSVRTIYRDIETLSCAGIPVYMRKGKGGGISLLENFVLNKTVLSDTEQNEILTALQTLNVINYPNVDLVISKLGALFNKSNYNWIDVDFSHWGSKDQGSFNLLKTAIVKTRVISFDYFSSYGEKTIRTIEPLQLLFKDKAWYLKSFCLSKQAHRTFKLTRMKNVVISEIVFKRKLPLELVNETTREIKYNESNLKLRLNPCVAYRVYDEFDENEIVKNADGSFEVSVTYPENEWVYGYILSFGSFAEVIEPKHIKDIVIERLEETLKQYKK
ncbi:YafY family transcriptional regulator [Desulfosporosinus fructosivorans]|uniref:YafY family transcriptional regulator n=1 Tax=Desulfosporosinus fructosivorans TaxID=2018669 RepID=A0A4Z0R5R2_9FIRM|nr:YafY family protein [Desulfosporosinus fructosivorans]TGE38441.1 YafY family transcriptional regulator [Desulfosporosinus fructosivorans]